VFDYTFVDIIGFCVSAISSVSGLGSVGVGVSLGDDAGSC
jgi:hypothetical protein